MRAALYARVSTANNGQNPQVQVRELLDYCGRRGWEIVATYIDHGVSGSKESRPELDKLLAAARRREFDVLLCWKLDRLARSLKHLVNLLSELESLGVALVSLSDSLDLSTPQGRLMFQIIGAMAEFERSLIQERVRSGLRNARAKGKRLGRPRVIVDAARIAGLRAQGLSWPKIARELGLSVGTVYRVGSSLSKIPAEDTALSV